MPAPAGEWDLPLSLDLDDSDVSVAASKLPSKRDCERCERPRSVCLCPSLPAEPLPLAGQVIVLQHPHEHKKRLATVPVLEKCVTGVEVLRSRTYRPQHPAHAALQAALAGAEQGRFPLLVLFPGAGARDVREVGAQLRSKMGSSSSGSMSSGSTSSSGRMSSSRMPQQAQQQQQQALQVPPAQQPPAQQHDPLYVLFVIDGTWKQAREMFNAALPHLMRPKGGPGVRVQLPPQPLRGEAAGARRDQQGEQQEPDQQGQQAPQKQQREGEQQQAQQQQQCAGQAAAAAAEGGSDGGGGGREGPLLLRMEPMEGCLTTCEAVARALGALEPEGEAVQAAILRPLAQLALFQARFDPAVAGRLQKGAGYSQARCRMGLSKQSVLNHIR